MGYVNLVDSMGRRHQARAPVADIQTVLRTRCDFNVKIFLNKVWRQTPHPDLNNYQLALRQEQQLELTRVSQRLARIGLLTSGHTPGVQQKWFCGSLRVGSVMSKRDKSSLKDLVKEKRNTIEQGV